MDPESVYNNGYDVYAGYSRLFKHIGLYIGLNVLCVKGYAKGIENSAEYKVSGIDHEWNIIK